MIPNANDKASRRFQTPLREIDEDMDMTSQQDHDDDDVDTEPEDEEQAEDEDRFRKQPAEDIDLGDNWKMRDIHATRDSDAETDPESDTNTEPEIEDEDSAAVPGPSNPLDAALKQVAEDDGNGDMTVSISVLERQSRWANLTFIDSQDDEQNEPRFHPDHRSRSTVEADEVSYLALRISSNPIESSALN